MSNSTSGIEGAHQSKSHCVTVATVQFSCSDELEQNLKRAEALVRQAASRGANIVLLQELFGSRYFPIDQIDCSDLAISQDEDDTYLCRFQKLAKELEIVLPISFFERCK